MFDRTRRQWKAILQTNSGATVEVPILSYWDPDWSPNEGSTCADEIAAAAAAMNNAKAERMKDATRFAPISAALVEKADDFKKLVASAKEAGLVVGAAGA